MKIFGMGGLEIVIILVVVLLIFGPKNLPKLGNAFGKTISNLRAGMNEGKKKNENAEAPAEEEATPAAEIEGEVEEVVADAKEAQADIAEEAESVVDEVDAVADGVLEDAAEAPKKVKRVVRKKVVTEESAEQSEAVE